MLNNSIRFMAVAADKVTGLSMGLRKAGKEKLGLGEKSQVQVIGELPNLAGIAGVLGVEKVQAIIEQLAKDVQFNQLKDSLDGLSSVPEQEFPVAGWLDMDTVAVRLWNEYNPDMQRSRASNAITAEEVEALYGEEILPKIDAAVLAKNPNVNKAQLAKAHALYMQHITKLFSKAAGNWLGEAQAEILLKILAALVADLDNPDSFASMIKARMEHVGKLQAERDAKLAKEQAELGELL